MPWSYPDNVPAVAQNWTDEEQQACVEAANAVLEETGDEEQAIYACIRAAGKGDKRMKHKAFEIRGFKALPDEPEGTFEAIVAVFGNIDSYGDMIVPGAFKDSLAKWESSGRPIPVIFSHQWENIDAHIGEVLDAKEVDKGLYVKGRVDLEEEFAAKVWKRMKNGTLTQFSFAYDIDEGAWVHKTQDGQQQDYYELRKLDLFEVGPCLVGANRETELLSVKDILQASGDRAKIQGLHDLLVSLGAKCSRGSDSDGEDEGGGEGEAGDRKPSTVHPSVIAARMRLDVLREIMED